MRRALAITFAVLCFLISVALLVFINLGTYEAVSLWGVSDAVDEITGSTWNISVFAGCWIVGLLSLAAGVSVLKSERT